MKRSGHRGWHYDGKLYFFGGKDDSVDSGAVVNTIEAFDPNDKTWSSFQTVDAPELAAFALALNGDQVRTCFYCKTKPRSFPLNAFTA